MPTRPDYLSISRHGTYYFRIVTPRTLRAALGTQKEIRRSLQTDSLRLALRLARQYAARYQYLFDRMLDVIGRDDYEPTEEDLKLYSELIAERSKPDAWGAWGDQLGQSKASEPEQSNEQLEEKQRYDEVAKLLTGAYGRAIPAQKQDIAKQLLEVSEPYPATQLRKVLPGILDKLVAQRISSTTTTNAPSTIVLPKPEASTITLYELWKLHWDHLASLNVDKALNTRDAEDGHARRLTVLSGGKGVGQLTLNDFNRIYRQIPELKPLRGCKIPNSGEAKDILATGDEATISSASADKVMIRLHTLHKFAYLKELTTVDPAKTDRPKLIRKKAPDANKKNSFSTDDLNAIFSGYLYCGTEIDGVDHIYPYQFWAPLLGLFTGARLNEICQLDTTDVQFDKESQLWTISLTEDTNDSSLPKSLKNQPSWRVLPIHNELIRIGFIDFVKEAAEEGRNKLFSDGLVHNPRKHWGSIATTFFTRMPSASTKAGGYFYRVGIRSRDKDGRTDNKTFHAFRHTFVHRIRNIPGEDAKLRESLSGHAGERNQNDEYGDGFDLVNKHRALHKANFLIDASKISYREFQTRFRTLLSESIRKHREKHELNQG
ncbi:DUF6538 domain-containing protein [Pseudomonas carassii]|uniref:DUF6538 domain-containing protein n=1 Tax=Pseudomonas carassii TaxID=3115855 RepID=A0ABU7HGN8_9PSED|nr:DUF6538 domain-containing protein [Pseudomonas sp. 137P]MEE1890479.1 DUF6538 domain-containing protein [Pseudomonas sp. 137P]